jgi:hypothetical protein
MFDGTPDQLSGATTEDALRHTIRGEDVPGSSNDQDAVRQVLHGEPDERLDITAPPVCSIGGDDWEA